MNEAAVKRLRERYTGKTIELTAPMDDPHPIPVGSRGKCTAVDDMGQLCMAWYCGRSLSLIPGVDSFRIVEDEQ